MIRKTASIGLGIALCASAVVGQSPLRVLRLDYVIVREGLGPAGQPRHIEFGRTVWMAPDGRERTETRDPEVPVRRVTLTDTGRDIQVELDPDLKIAVRINRFEERVKSGQPIGGRIPTPVDRKEDLGSETIQGFPCQGWRNRHSGLMTEHWFCRDPISGKKFLGSTFWSFPDGKSTARTELQQVQRGVAVDAAMFEIPRDFRIIDK